MTLAEFKKTIEHNAPPPGLTPLLEALWYDSKGDWDAAHNRAQDIPSPDGSWVHAYLHRKEGDLSNASYWYHKAGQPRSDKTLNEEWDEIAKALLR